MPNPYVIVDPLLPPNDGQGRKAFNKTVFQCATCDTQLWFLTISGIAVCANCRKVTIQVRIVS